MYVTTVHFAFLNLRKVHKLEEFENVYLTTNICGFCFPCKSSCKKKCIGKQIITYTGKGMRPYPHDKRAINLVLSDYLSLGGYIIDMYRPQLKTIVV